MSFRTIIIQREPVKFVKCPANQTCNDSEIYELCVVRKVFKSVIERAGSWHCMKWLMQSYLFKHNSGSSF